MALAAAVWVCYNATRTMADRIPVRNPNEISKLRKAGEVSARILMELQTIIRPGITTKEIDDYAKELFLREMLSRGANKVQVTEGGAAT